jgi:hypothetical protein
MAADAGFLLEQRRSANILCQGENSLRSEVRIGQYPKDYDFCA